MNNNNLTLPTKLITSLPTNNKLAEAIHASVGMSGSIPGLPEGIGCALSAFQSSGFESIIPGALQLAQINEAIKNTVLLDQSLPHCNGSIHRKATFIKTAQCHRSFNITATREETMKIKDTGVNVGFGGFSLGFNHSSAAINKSAKVCLVFCSDQKFEMELRCVECNDYVEQLPAQQNITRENVGGERELRAALTGYSADITRSQ
ncbi:hypothetical protein AKO1_003645 [Acrasis kona]|uniref:Uncharacterized protein n=1 Tax=Acrasis kona TaxID=1008807 RepID=A0AAW2Z5X7_9EUKA